MLGCSCRLLCTIYVQPNNNKKKHSEKEEEKKLRTRVFFRTPSAHHLAKEFVYIILSIIYDLSILFFSFHINLPLTHTHTHTHTTSLRIISHLIDTMAMRCRDENKREREDRITSMMLFARIPLLVIVLIEMHYLGTDTFDCHCCRLSDRERERDDRRISVSYACIR